MWSRALCGAGEGWGRSVGAIELRMKCYVESRRTGIFYTQ